MYRPLHIRIAIGVLMVLSACAHPRSDAPEASQSPFPDGTIISGGNNPNDDMLAPDNRGDVLVLSNNVDFTKVDKDRIKNIETLSMLNAIGARNKSMIIIDAAHVLAMAGTGFAAPTDPGYDPNPALRIDGDADDRLLLLGGDDSAISKASGGRWLRGAGNGTNGVPAGYDLYVHVTKGFSPTANADAYLVVQKGIAVRAR
jgi:hypothetical protein